MNLEKVTLSFFQLKDGGWVVFFRKGTSEKIEKIEERYPDKSSAYKDYYFTLQCLLKLGLIPEESTSLKNIGGGLTQNFVS